MEFSNEKPDEEMNKQIECQQNAANKVNIDKKMYTYPIIYLG